jgi:hypothetical protein
MGAAKLGDERCKFGYDIRWQTKFYQLKFSFIMKQKIC